MSSQGILPKQFFSKQISSTGMGIVANKGTFIENYCCENQLTFFFYKTFVVSILLVTKKKHDQILKCLIIQKKDLKQ